MICIGNLYAGTLSFFSLQEGITPLMLATANHRINCVQILLQEGAEPHLKSNVIFRSFLYVKQD